MYLGYDNFSRNRLSENIRQAIANQPGRFFGIVCYSGFEQVNYGSKIATSIAIAAGTAILTGGLFWATVVPQSPYLNTYFAIIDKQNDCVLFYHVLTTSASPVKDQTVRSQFERLFRKIQ